MEDPEIAGQCHTSCKTATIRRDVAELMSSDIAPATTREPKTFYDWWWQLNVEINKPVASEDIDEFKRLISLTSRFRNSRGFNHHFNLLLSKTINAGKPLFALALIDNTEFKWNSKYGKNGFTALHDAMEKRQELIVLRILQLHHDAIYASDGLGHTPLHYAVM